MKEEVQMELFEPGETIRRVSAVHKNIIDLLTKERFYDAEIDRSIREQLQRFIPKTHVDAEVKPIYVAPITQNEIDDYFCKKIFGKTF
jgi:hypothetical protein